MSKKDSKILSESSWIETALDIAQVAHLGQKRRGDKSPYITHPVRVHSIAKKFGYSKVVQVASILHDAIEDAKNPDFVEDLIRQKLPNVLDIVKSLTHEKSQAYDQYLLSLSGDALQVKMSDMLHNLLDSPRERQKAKYRVGLQALYYARKGRPTEIRDEHWTFLLRQVGLPPEIQNKKLSEDPTLLRKYIRLMLEMKMLPEGRERFNLRKSAGLLISPVFKIVNELLDKNSGVIEDNFEITMVFNGDETEIDYLNGDTNGSITIEITDDELLSRLDSMGSYDVSFNLKIAKTFVLSGDYVFDHNGLEDDDLGGVEVYVHAPASMFEDKDTLLRIQRQIRGTIAHELQHIIQRIIHGDSLLDINKGYDNNIESHIRDSNEIDARIEEIIAACENEHDLCDIKSFRTELNGYAEDYFERNGMKKDHPQYLKLKREMIDSHLIKYREKFDLWG